ncbi:ABC transporter ATP-binding protein [Laceyella putida]|uniref:ABC transporter ATP-binding protein n=1 Tax=Laceyella putida TaxID=110101 RepID=A0ABW2RM23_9BACL
MKLEVKGLSFTYEQRPVIQGLHFSVQDGEFVSLIGPSGSGKSTLFYLLGGLYRPQAGEIHLNGRLINGERGHLAYMPQQPSLMPWRTIFDNVRLAQELTRRTDRVRLNQLLKEAGLAEVARRYPHELSGGMQQRVAFIRALASDHDLLCLDEPFGALDALTRTRMQKWLLSLLEQERRTILFITHSIEEAILLSDRILVLSPSPMKVAQEVAVPFARGQERDERRGTKEWIRLQRELEAMLLPT